jgi:MerR family mercuric resistance operon transcriptional regulator
MLEQYTIGQLARAAEVPTSTVRYYERVGLLTPDDRSIGNYRLYDARSLSRLRFIRAAQRIGFTLEDVRQLLSIQDEGGLACREVQEIITRRVAEIDSRLRDLRHVRRVLQDALRRCRESESRGRCHVMGRLKEKE